MRNVISISEVAASHQGTKGLCEVMASAEATYNEAQSVLLVQLEAYLRPVGCEFGSRRLMEGWLPPKDMVVEAVSFEDAIPATREIFQRWVEKVRRCIPAVNLQ